MREHNGDSIHLALIYKFTTGSIVFWLNVLLITAATIFIALVAVVYLAPNAVTDFALRAERRRCGLVRKEIELTSGLHFAYLEGGAGETLMLLHGFGGNKDNFARVSRFLVKHYRVIVPDIVGFGESSHLMEADYSPPAQVDRLRAFAQALGITQLHLGGNSMGGQIAMIYASLYPTEVKSLWLLSPGGLLSAPKSDVFKTFVETGNNLLIVRTVEQFQQVMALGMEKRPWIPKPMLKVLAQERIQNAVLEAHIFRQIVDYPVEQQIDGMNTPTLVVFGDKDRVILVQTVDVLKKLLPHMSVRILSGVGHVPMFENARQCAQDYLLFRSSIRSME